MVAGGRSVAKRVLVALAVVVIALVGAFAWYVNDYYRADDVALAAAADENGVEDGVTVRQLQDGSLAFVPEHPCAGFVFYPGGKVQPEAYAPLLEGCAERGVLCVLTRPPFNLAILDVDAAAGVPGQFPEVRTWAIGGHSLGGAAASMHAAQHLDEYCGIVFLAAYPNADLTSFDGAVVTVVGDADGVLNRAKYDEARSSLPQGAREVSVEGGNHANFGNYGDQAGDGVAAVTREEQQAQAVDAIVDVACGGNSVS